MVALPAPDKIRVAVAVSGGGRTLAHFLKQPRDAYHIAAVIASRADCKGAEIARGHALPLFVGEFSHRDPETPARLEVWLQQQAISWVALAGFIRPYPVSATFAQRVVNIHPSLLPRYGGKGMYGLRVHQAVLAGGEHVSGATVHFVNDRYDDGAIIAQITSPVRAGDDAVSLADRVFAAECWLYPQVLERLVLGTLPRSDGEVERYAHDEL